jgi:type I restriction enzyme S subunit
VIIATRVGLGKVCILEQDTAINQDLRALIPKDSSLDVKYLFHWYKSVADQVEKAGIGATVKGVTLPFVKALRIPVPPIEEQRRIVAILDEAFACIDKAKANTEKNIQNARELFDSYLNNIFSNPGPDWEKRGLGEIGNVSMCKRVYKEQTTANGDIPFYKIGTFGKEPDSFISNEIYDDFRSKYSFPQVGDVLLSAAGTIGRRVKYDGRPAYFQDSNIIWLAHDESQVLNDYLFHFYGACEWGSTKGATISRLYNDNLRQIKISFPKSSDEQRTIVQRLDSLSSETQNAAAISQRKMDGLESLRKSILQKAFSGDL